MIIKKAEIAVEKMDQRTNRFAVGDALDTMIVHLDESAINRAPTTTQACATFSVAL